MFDKLLERRRKIREIETRPLFNIEITLDGWNHPYPDIESFLRMGRKAQIANDLFGGKSYVLGNGKLMRGDREGLHLYQGSVQLDDWHCQIPPDKWLRSFPELQSPH